MTDYLPSSSEVQSDDRHASVALAFATALLLFGALVGTEVIATASFGLPEGLAVAMVAIVKMPLAVLVARKLLGR